MGYTHYWTIPSAFEWQKTWLKLVSDTRLIVDKADVPLSKYGGFFGPNDEGPEINSQSIHLNGPPGHSKDSFILEPWATRGTCCKTRRREYDFVVTAILLRASQLAGPAIRIECVRFIRGFRSADVLTRIDQLGWKLGRERLGAGAKIALDTVARR